MASLRETVMVILARQTTSYVISGRSLYFMPFADSGSVISSAAWRAKMLVTEEKQRASTAVKMQLTLGSVKPWLENVYSYFDQALVIFTIENERPVLTIIV